MAGRTLTDTAVRGLRGAALVVVLGAGVTACASTQQRYPLADLGETRSAPPPAGTLHGTEKPYEVNGQWYYPKADPGYDEVGLASWYGYPFQQRHTADGEMFDENVISAAHKTLPLPCIVEVTNLENGRRIQVRVNDRGPFVDGRLIDLSKAAAQQLGFDRQGVTKVRVRYVSVAPALAVPGLMQAAYRPSSSYSGQSFSGQSYSAAQPLSADGFDGIEQADAGGHIRPDASPVGAPIQSETDAGPPPVSRSGATITASPLRALPSTTPSIVGGAYAVQAGAFGSRYAADRAVARLSAAGSAQVTPIQRNGGVLYRVTVGAFPDPNAAAVTKLKVIASGFADAKVVQAD
jgi:rare lipoprotein A